MGNVATVVGISALKYEGAGVVLGTRSIVSRAVAVGKGANYVAGGASLATAVVGFVDNNPRQKLEGTLGVGEAIGVGILGGAAGAVVGFALGIFHLSQWVRDPSTF